LPRVISKTEEANAIPRRSHPRTVRPRQWHVTKGGPIVEKELQKGVSPNMTEMMVAASTFNASYQTS